MFDGATRLPPGKNVGGAKDDERGTRDSQAEKNSISRENTMSWMYNDIYEGIMYSLGYTERRE